jgi:hypothetical protein
MSSGSALPLLPSHGKKYRLLALGGLGVGRTRRQVEIAAEVRRHDVRAVPQLPEEPRDRTFLAVEEEVGRDRMVVHAGVDPLGERLAKVLGCVHGSNLLPARRAI